MQNLLNIVGIQADLVWKNPTQNKAFFEEKINLLPNTTDIVVLPEMFTTGFTMYPENVAETMDGISVSWMQKMATKNDVAIIGSLVIKEPCHIATGDVKNYNRLVFAHPSGEIETYNKRHSFTLAGEDKVYTSGNKKLIINFKGWKICPLICYDLRFPVWARNTEDYDVLIYIANWPVTRIKAWDTLLKARAIENMSYVVGVNRIGKDANNYEYSGNSLVVDYLGEELSSLENNASGIIKSTLSKSSLHKTREKLRFLNDKDDFIITY